MRGRKENEKGTRRGKEHRKRKECGSQEKVGRKRNEVERYPDRAEPIAASLKNRTTI